LRQTIGLFVLLVALLINPMAFAGLDEGIAARERGDYAMALSEFQTLAEQENAEAQTYLGLMYIKGEGVPHDFVKALEWYRKAAEQDAPQAQHFLGVVYARNHGIYHDDGEAVKWFRKSAEQNYAPAQYNLGLMVEYGWGVLKDPVEAYKWYSLAAAQGDADGERNKTNLKRRLTAENISKARELVRTWTPCGTDRPCP